MKKILLVLSLVILSTVLLRADVFIRQQNLENGVTTITDTWIGDGVTQIGGDPFSLIIHGKTKKIFILNNRYKTYVETLLPLNIAMIVPEEIAGMVGGAQSTASITVTPKGQTAVFGNWNTKGYDLEVNIFNQQARMSIWASSEVPFDWEQYMELYAEMYKMTTMTGESFTMEFKKIDGFPLVVETRLEGKITTSKVIEISEKIPPPGIYTVPIDYTKKYRFGTEEFQ